MHSSVNNHDTTTSILSIKEIIGIVAVFSFVLYLIFPKKNIDHIIETKSKNTNLSINYLESMLLYYPDNIKLEMILLRNYEYANKKEKAFKLIDKILSQTKDKKILDTVYKTQYKLIKESYFENNSDKTLSKAREKLYDYFEFTGEDRDYIYFLVEATQMGFQKLKYISLKELIKNKSSFINYQLKKEAFYLASSLGYKDDAKNILLDLIDSSKADQNLKDYALSTLLSQKDYPKAIQLATNLFQKSKDNSKKEGYFNIALYATAISSDNNKTAINKLINLYKESIQLDAHNIYFILDNLLKVGDIKGASSFAIDSFENYANLFDEQCVDLAIKSMVYNQDLAPALDLALFAEDKFHNKKWLDKSIQLALWQGDIKTVVDMNILGYKKYRDKKYEKYLLEETTLDNGYKILGEIYRKKIEEDRDYNFVEKMAQYFDYTALTAQGEEYFTKLYKKHKNRNILKQAILFSYKNNSYKKGLKLYDKYRARFGIDKILQQEAINRLIALKRFKEAYNLTKALEKREKYDKKLQVLLKKLHIEDKFQLYTKLTDLAWIYKDYRYIYNILWKLERENRLDSNGYSKLISLEKELNHNKKLAHLYKRMWKKTKKPTYFIGLLYLYNNKKDYKSFKKAIESLTPKEKKILQKDINYHILLANYYIYTQKTKLAMNSFQDAFKIDRNSIMVHEAYLWFLIDNQLKSKLHEEIGFLKNHPKLREEIGLAPIVGAMLTKQNQLALEWIRPHLNSQVPEYRELYSELKMAEKNRLQNMLDNYSTNSKVYINYKKLSKDILAKEQGVTQQWNLYKNIDSKLSIIRYKYLRKNKRDIEDNTIKLNLKNKNSNLLWDISLAKHNSIDDFMSGSLDLSYNIDDMILKANSKYQNKTKHTTQLFATGMENSLTLSATEILSNTLNFTLLYQKADYKIFQDKTKVSIGELNQFELTSNYILRTGYPDIIFGAYIFNNQYNSTIDNWLPKDFTELGGQVSIGSASLDRLHREFRPFGSFGLAINNHNNIGTSLQLGVSGEITGGDIFSLMFKYSKEVDNISKPYYEVDIGYKF
ncbi:MAG: tetratricopeptide repeat protein [Epsilonproteobacteria bacterium]|nr:tetratricopeptide repeat protein [Campylobacterota bacterium]